MRFAVPLALFVWLAACGGASETDRRFSTPEHTVETLLGAYGLEGVSQEDIRARLAIHGRFELVDRAAHDACFEDLDGPIAEGLAGYVVGLLAAGRDELRTEIAGDRATVSPREGVRVVLRRRGDATFRIVLRESVPPDVQERFAALAERAERGVQRR